MPDKTILLTHRETRGCCSRLIKRVVRSMTRSLVTIVKVTLVFLNIWVLAVVLLVSLDQWRVFESSDPKSVYRSSHLMIMRELQEEADGKLGWRKSNSSSLHNMSLAAGVHSLILDAVQPLSATEFSPQVIILREITPRAATATTGAPATAVQDTRIANLHYWCMQQHPTNTQYQNISKNKLNSILVDQRHKLLFCQIPGIAINEWRKMMLILSGVVNETRTDAISGGDVYNKYAKLPKRLDQFGEKEREEMLKTYHKVMFVRDPLERLVIAYRTKLLSKGSIYFHKTFGSAIIKKYRKNASTAEIKAGNNVRFSEFVKFIIDNEHAGTENLNDHWGQYYKQCHPCLVNYNFVGTFENVENDTRTVINKVRASKSITPPYVTDTKILSEAELTKIYKDVSAHDLNNLFKVYSADYTLFGYRCPSFVHQLLQKGNLFHDY